MMQSDLTKFIVVLIILGILLGVVIFRPQIIPSLSSEPSGEPGQVGAADAAAQTQLEPGAFSYEDLLAWQEELELRHRILDQREAALQAYQERSDETEASLQAEQARLAQEWESLQAEQARLGQESVNFQAELARLRQKEADLAELEQKLQGFRRWSVVALFVSSVLALPSVLVLIALVRHPGSVSQRGWSTEVTSAPTSGDNRRDRERVRHRR